MSDEARVEILPCPFCGGEAHQPFDVSSKGDDPAGWWYIVCKTCPEVGTGGHGTPEQATAKWNTRAHIEKKLFDIEPEIQRRDAEIERLRGLLTEAESLYGSESLFWKEVRSALSPTHEEGSE